MPLLDHFHAPLSPHHDLMILLGQPSAATLDQPLYAVAYHPAVREQGGEIDIWPQVLRLDESLPVVPLALDAETMLPIDLEETYTAARRRRRL